MTRVRTPQALSIVVAAALVTGCATAGSGIRPAPFPGSPAIADHPVSNSPGIPLDVPRLVQTAMSLQGSPYLFGGENPATGFDCSGLVRYLFREQGWELPRTAREQFEYGRKVDVRQIQPGDLLFFATESNGASHVGIAIDAAVAPDARSGRAFIHAPGANSAVRIDMLETSYWQSRFLGARRLF
jgi:cell wall-associated NlpC family hydrolase